MQTLKIKLAKEYTEIIKYQKQYSILLHTAIRYMLKDEKLKSLYDYTSKTKSNLLQKLSKIKYIDLMNSWFIQCAISEAYGIVTSFNSQVEIYKSKAAKRDDFLLKKNKTFKENKLLEKLLTIKEPRIIFGRKKKS